MTFGQPCIYCTTFHFRQSKYLNLISMLVRCVIKVYNINSKALCNGKATTLLCLAIATSGIEDNMSICSIKSTEVVILPAMRKLNDVTIK